VQHRHAPKRLRHIADRDLRHYCPIRLMPALLAEKLINGHGQVHRRIQRRNSWSDHIAIRVDSGWSCHILFKASTASNLRTGGTNGRRQ
jgi:hypothetical protein